MTPILSSAYPIITHALPIACNLPMKTLVARQQPASAAIQNECIDQHAWNVCYVLVS